MQDSMKQCSGCLWQRGLQGWSLWGEATVCPMLDTAGSSWFQSAPVDPPQGTAEPLS